MAHLKLQIKFPFPTFDFVITLLFFYGVVATPFRIINKSLHFLVVQLLLHSNF